MVSTTKTVQPDEDHIKLGFLGSYEERAEALEQLWQMYSSRLTSYVEGEFPALPKDLVANAVLDAYRQLFSKVEAQDFDLDRPLVNWLFKTCWRRAADERRKYVRRPLNSAELLDCIGNDLEGTEVGSDWQELARQDKAKEAAEEFRRFLLTLPDVQHQVAQVEADFYPDKPNREEICEEIYRRTGKRPTVVQVKSARAQIWQKLRSFVERRKNRKNV
ncbi:MAG: sigma-70 family RNA polymerase sigma factor [Verrucomicrobia bacterium]|nr:sigma-70 family RNA polymerase sigma factor [Verrucomicrobiota bacterium]